MSPLRLPGATEEGLNTRKLKVYTMTELYDPAIFSSAVLAANKTEWIGDVKESYMEFVDFASRVKCSAEVTKDDQTKIQHIIGSVTEDYRKFLSEFSAKCLITPDVTPTSGSDDSSSVNGDAIAQRNDTEKVKAAKVEVRINKERIDRGVLLLDTEVKQVPDWTSAQDHVIQLGMSSIGSWKKQLKDLHDRVWDVKRATECHDLDTTTLEECEVKVNTLVVEAELAMKVIKNEDSVRCLYSMVKSNNAEVRYPKFSGSIGEDFSKFEVEMKKALVMNQVRKADQVRVLRENLSGGALNMVPATVKDIDLAFTSLSKLYGCASKVMRYRKDQLLALGQFPVSDTNKSAKFVRSQVEWLISAEIILKDIFDIASTSVKLNREAFNPSNFEEILYLFPLKTYTQMSTIDGSVQFQFEALFSLMQTKRQELETILQYLPEAKDDPKTRKETTFSSVRPPEWDEMDEIDREYWTMMCGYETDEEDEIDKEYRLLMHGYEED